MCMTAVLQQGMSTMRTMAVLKKAGGDAYEGSPTTRTRHHGRRRGHLHALLIVRVVKAAKPERWYAQYLFYLSNYLI